MSARMASTERVDHHPVGDASDRWLQRIPWVTSDGLAVVEDARSPRIVWANPALHGLLAASPGTLVGSRLRGVPAVPVADGPIGVLEELIDQPGLIAWCDVLRPDGPSLTASVVLEPLAGGSDGPWLMTVREVSEQVRADERLRTSEERFRALASHAPIGVALSDVGIRLGYVNERLAEMWARPVDDLVGHGWLDPVDEADRARLVDGVAATLDGQEQRVAIRIERPGGEIRCVDVRLAPVNFAGAGAGFVASMEDLTESRDRELRLAWQATHDPLTGLANRTALRVRSEEVLAPGGPGGALLFFDLDDFKLVNDSLGHQAGDELLRTIARRFQESIRGGDLVARLGGDEFVVLCTGILDEVEATATAERLLSRVARPVVVEETELLLSASVGVVIAWPGTSPDDVLRDADVAMYQAKHGGKARTAVFDETVRQRTRQRLDLMTDLRAALGAGHVGLAYQPIVSLEDRRIVGAEALLRFEHRDIGTVSANEMVALAEDTGCVVELGACVLRLATQQLRRWRQAGCGPGIISVNLAARHFEDPGLVDLVVDSLRSAGLRPADLWLEVTESQLMAELDDASATLDRLHAMGVGLALDDFGAGFSSLAYLRRIPATVLKLDRSFTQGLGEGDEAEAIVGSVTSMARALGRTVVLEGVETPAQLAAAIRLGCHQVQGYLLARPGPAADLPREVIWP